MPDIDSLTSQAKQLGESVNRWNNIVLVTMFCTAILGVVYFLFTAILATKSKILATAQSELIAAKDRQLQTDLKAKDLEIGQLKKESEQLSAGNLRLEAAITPRRLSARQQKDLASLNKFSNRLVEIKSYSSDTEGLILATQILDDLTKSKISIRDNRLTMQPAGSVSFGLSVEGPDGELVQELRKILSLDGNLIASSSIVAPNPGFSATIAFGVTSGGTPPAATVMVGVKPIK
jgi:hypothetical protein